MCSSARRNSSVRPAAAGRRLRERQVPREQAAERAAVERRRQAGHRRGGRGQPVAQVGEPEVRGQGEVQVVGDLLVQARDEARVFQRAARLQADPRHPRAHAVLGGEGDDGVEAERAPAAQRRAAAHGTRNSAAK